MFGTCCKVKLLYRFLNSSVSTLTGQLDSSFQTGLGSMLWVVLAWVVFLILSCDRPWVLHPQSLDRWDFSACLWGARPGPTLHTMSYAPLSTLELCALPPQCWRSLPSLPRFLFLLLVLLFSCLVVSDSWRPCGLQHARLPHLHCLPEFTQTRVHWVSDDIQPSHPLSPPCKEI